MRFPDNPCFERRLAILITCWFVGIGCSSKDSVETAPPPRSASAVTSDRNVLPAVAIDTTLRPEDWFEDISETSGIQFAYRNGREAGMYTILETVGGGVGMLDYDGDGDLDLYFTGGGEFDVAAKKVNGRPSALYRNDGAWKFTDVTSAAGLDLVLDYSHGAFVGDFDRDGWPDLFVTCYGRSRLFHNRKDGTFEDVTETAGLAFQNWSTAAAWFDYDADGWPDLFVAGYVEWTFDPNEKCDGKDADTHDTCPPQKYPAAPDRLFRNRGDGTFEEVSQTVGLRGDGKGLGALAADFNSDGHVDLYVANDQVENHFYLADGPGRFQESGRIAGVALNEFGSPEGSMGVDAADVNGDESLDLFVTNFELEDNSLYQNRGTGLFDHATVRWGLGGKGRPLVGFGTALADFDHDTRPDLLVLNGHVAYHRGIHPWEQFPALYRNRDNNRFDEITSDGGTWFRTPHAARGVAVGDLDNDGALDLVIVSQNEPVAILRNRNVPKRWVRLELAGTTCDPRGVGAVVTLAAGTVRSTQFVKSGAGYLSSFDSRLSFSIPSVENDAETIRVTVRWPGGQHESFESVLPNQSNRIVQGDGTKIEN